MPLEFMPLNSFLNDVPLFGPSDGFDGNGLDADGYNRGGFRYDEDMDTMVDREGYNEAGYREDRYCVMRDREGYDENGYNEDGYDEHGYDEHGYDSDGFNSEGYDENGYNEDGYDEWGDRRGTASGFFNGDPARYVFHSTADEKAEADDQGWATRPASG